MKRKNLNTANSYSGATSALYIDETNQLSTFRLKSKNNTTGLMVSVLTKLLVTEHTLSKKGLIRS